LNTIDFTTGVVVNMGEITVLNASGLASDLFDPELNPDDPVFSASASAVVIPTLQFYGLILLGTFLGLSGLRQLRQ
jgi:hypothetical protein